MRTIPGEFPLKWSAGVHSARTVRLGLSNRRSTGRYVTAILPQRWDMFSSPRLFDQYVRLNYYLAAPGDRRPQIVRELIYPSLADDDIRLAYAFRDKAVSAAMERFIPRGHAA